MVHSSVARRRAFTLIELLVVIAIIAILAAILFPVFAQAKLAAKKSAGLAQMKQIGTAAQLYAGDSDDGLPTWDSYNAVYPTTARAAVWTAAGSPPVNKRMWDALLFPYIKSDNFTAATGPTTAEYGGIFKSPGATYATKGNRSIGISTLLVQDLTMNEGGTGGACVADATPATNGCYRWPTGSIIEESAQTIFVGDSGKDGRLEAPFNLDGFNETFFTKPAVPLRSTPWRYGMDSANYVYADSHARSEKGDKLFPHPGRNRPIASWTAAEKQPILCAAVKWFAPSSGDKATIRSVMTGGGANCQ